jgi:hypothetical protein
LVDSSPRGFVRQRGVGGKRERWPESKRGGAWVKLTDGGGGGRLGPDIDGGAPVGRLRHTVREAVEGGRASLRAGGFGREEKNLCSAVTDYLKGGGRGGMRWRGVPVATTCGEDGGVVDNAQERAAVGGVARE